MRGGLNLSSRRFVLQNAGLMKKNPVFILGALAATSMAAHGALVWQVGMDDNAWPLTGTTGGPQTNFVQENGAISPLPGSPNSTPTPQGADNDYYFAGSYTTVLPGNGAYAPVGVVGANENSAERAFAAADNDLRYHFNLPAGMNANDSLSFTYEPLNLDDPANPVNTDLRYGAEVYFNGVLVMPQVITRPGDLLLPVTTPQFTLASVGAVTGPGADNIVSLRGINYNGSGGGNWMGIDYVQLDVQPIPEPGSAAMVLLGAIGCSVFLGRRRSR
jgi:hypothetical protein